MKKNNSKKWIKTITITTAVLVFAAGAVFALKSAGTANTDKDSADTVVAAANEASLDTPNTLYGSVIMFLQLLTGSVNSFSSGGVELCPYT